MNKGRIRRMRLTALLPMVIVAISATGSPAQAVADRGLIVFQSDRGGHVNLWTMRPDGSGQTKLTDDKVEDVFPSWSPDGTRIAWTRGGFAPSGEIWVMNADGSGKTQLTFNAYSDLGVTWSPDGSRIAFRSNRGNNRDIYVINADGSGEQRLTDAPGGDIGASWSPDGSKIAFTSDRSGSCAVHTMNVDGTGVQQLTPDSENAGVAGWSPDGTRIVFANNFCANSESDLFVMNADGTGVNQITDTAQNELSKSWSPDGSQVVADLGVLTPSNAHLHKGDIALIAVVGGGTINLTNTPGINEEHPDWSSATIPLARLRA